MSYRGICFVWSRNNSITNVFQTYSLSISLPPSGWWFFKALNKAKCLVPLLPVQSKVVWSVMCCKSITSVLCGIHALQTNISALKFAPLTMFLLKDYFQHIRWSSQTKLGSLTVDNIKKYCYLTKRRRVDFNSKLPMVSSAIAVGLGNTHNVMQDSAYFRI